MTHRISIKHAICCTSAPSQFRISVPAVAEVLNGVRRFLKNFGRVSADTITTSSFNFGDTESVVVDFDLDTSTVSLTVGGQTFAGSVGGSSRLVTQFALRQSTSTNNERIFVDNLVVSHVTAIPEPGQFALLGFGVVGIVTRRRRRRRE
ncbi:MAG: PEP-CTERM sorting domain-containing protein, partial [Planctomycetales bacterium]|nr:PEP-CTERM sorting domain-containing protein [Planctomycetales bacterium]